MLKVTVNSKNVDDFVRQLTIQGTKAERIAESEAPQIGAAVSALILKAIEDDVSVSKNFAEFMAERTQIDMTWAGGKLVLSISGRPEQEIENPQHRSGSAPKDGSVNLWNRHEYGGGSDSFNGLIVFEKDKGSGVTVVRKSRSASVGGKNRGFVGRVIAGLNAQIAAVVGGMGALVANSAAAEIVEGASKGKIKIDRRAKSAFKKAGVSEALLAELGVMGVSVNDSTGQINLIGKSQTGRVTFISAGGAVPTTINK